MHEAKPSPAPILTLTIREALRATGIGKTTLYKLIDDGKVRRVKVGKRTLIVFEDLQKLVTPEDCTMRLGHPNKQSASAQPLDAA
jgi:excisionase family DNA binding protein